MSDQAAVAEELRNKAKAAAEGEGSSNPPTFKFETAGQELIGTVEKIDYVGTRNGESHLMQIKVLDTDDIVTVWCSQTVLKNQVLDIAPAVGSVIVIIYEGKKHSEKSGYDYNSYQVQASESDFQAWADVTREGAERIKLKAAANAPQGGVVDIDDLEDAY